jgi:hypothetical protein
MAPPIVCLSYQRATDARIFDPQLIHAGGLDDRAALELVTNWLTHHETLVGHHVVYDMAVVGAKWPHLIPLIFAKYDRDEVTCTKLRQQLLDIAGGQFRGYLQRFTKDVTKPDGTTETVEGAVWRVHNYGLDDLAYRLLGRRLDKAPKKKNPDGTMPEDTSWQKRYGELKGIPITQWPEAARIYPLEDAHTTLEIYQQQEVHKEYIEDQFRQARAAWALHLTQTWGLRTHGPSVERLERETRTALAAIEDGLVESGLVRKDGTRDTRKAMARMVAVCRAAGKPIRLTESGEKKFKEYKAEVEEVADTVEGVTLTDAVYDRIAAKGGIALDSDACEECADDLLEDYAERTSLQAMLNKDCSYLKAGTVYPVHTSYGMAASCRSTSSKPNVQNPKRSGDVHRDGKIKYTLPDVRECWMPRDGMIFAQADFDQLELRTLAQACVTLFGESVLADMLNSGKDPHTAFACSILNISYEEGARRKKDKSDKEFDNARQLGKVFNFGSPGGLGAEKLCKFGRKTYQVYITPERAKELKQVWLDQFPEMRRYFAYVNERIDKDTGEGIIQQLFSNRWRGGCHYTAACNGIFQSLGADAAKRALYLVVRACYAEPDSVLYGSRPVLYVHDEIVMEVKNDEFAHDKAVEMARLMIAGANEFLPDVPAQTEPILATRWSKQMKAIYQGCAGCVAPAEAKVPHSAHERLAVWSPHPELVAA